MASDMHDDQDLQDAAEIAVKTRSSGRSAIRVKKPPFATKGRAIARTERVEGDTSHAVAETHTEIATPPQGWWPAPVWAGWGPLVSLRCGWQLAARTADVLLAFRTDSAPPAAAPGH